MVGDEPNLKTYYYHTDHLGSIQAVSDSTGSIVGSYTYDPFGNVILEQSYPDADRIRFTGKRLDATGLYYFNARYYDPTLGRFISADPARQGLNWYVYCNNNPLMFVDPDGLLNIIAIVGADRRSNNNAFINNTLTFINDHPEDQILMFKAWEYKNENYLMDAIASGFESIDLLIVNAHSNTQQLVLTSDWGITKDTDWSKLKFSQNAEIYLNGCNAGGRDGIVAPSSIAQDIADKTNTCVYAYVNNTSQQEIDGKYYQVPVRMYWGQKVVKEYTLFTPRFQTGVNSN